MNRIQKIEELISKFLKIKSEKDMFMEDLSYGEEENAYSNLCAIIKRDKIPLSSEDKQAIDEIGESMWRDGEYNKHNMGPKYWKDLIE